MGIVGVAGVAHGNDVDGLRKKIRAPTVGTAGARIGRRGWLEDQVIVEDGAASQSLEVSKKTLVTVEAVEHELGVFDDQVGQTIDREQRNAVAVVFEAWVSCDYGDDGVFGRVDDVSSTASWGFWRRTSGLSVMARLRRFAGRPG